MGPKKISPAAWAVTYGLHLPDQKTLLPPEQLPLSRVLNGESYVELDMFVKNAAVPVSGNSRLGTSWVAKRLPNSIASVLRSEDVVIAAPSVGASY